jgi:hypothetical protein
LAGTETTFHRDSDNPLVEMREASLYFDPHELS